MKKNRKYSNIIFLIIIGAVIIISFYIFNIYKNYETEKENLVKNINLYLQKSITNYNYFLFNSHNYYTYLNDSMLNLDVKIDSAHKTNNLIPNYDFELGDTLFTTTYCELTTKIYHYLFQPLGSYKVTDDPQKILYTFRSKGYGGRGNFMLVDASTSAQPFYEVKINVKPNTNYIFNYKIYSFFKTSDTNYNDVSWQRPLVLAKINGSKVSLDVSSRDSAVWKDVTGIWNSGNNSIAHIELADINTASLYNDFGIDELYFSEYTSDTSLLMNSAEKISIKDIEENKKSILLFLINEQFQFSYLSELGIEVFYDDQFLNQKLEYNEVEKSSSKATRYYQKIYESDNSLYTLPVNYYDKEVVGLKISNYKWYLIKKTQQLIFSLLIVVALVSIIIFITIRWMRKNESIRYQKYQLVNNLTHELKTPIATISAGIETLRNKNMDLSEMKVKEYYSILNDQLKKLNSIVDNSLNIFKIENTEFKLDLEKVFINELINEVYLEAYDIYNTVQNKNIDFQLDLLEDEIAINADKFHFKNSLFTLIENSVKYGNSIHPQIVIQSKLENNELILSIIDNGIGIDKKYQKLVFEKFFRVSTDDEHSIKGHGLGLSYVKSIMELHKIRINLESKLNEGTTIKLSIKYV